MTSELEHSGADAPAPRHPLAFFGRDLAPRTRAAYNRYLWSFLRFMCVDPKDAHKLAETKPQDIQAWLELSAERGPDDRLLNAPAIAVRLATVRALFRTLRAAGLMVTNPAEFIRAPRVTLKSPRSSLSTEESRAMVEVWRGKSELEFRNRAIVLLFLGTGIRTEELTRIRMQDLYRDRGYYVAFIRGKGDKHRTIPLSTEIRAAIEAYLKHSGPRAPDDAVFQPTESPRNVTTQKPLATRTVFEIVIRTAELAGIDRHISSHSLRHTAITLALDAGAKLERVQALAGHASPATTVRYLRSIEALDKSAAHAIRF